MQLTTAVDREVKRLDAEAELRAKVDKEFIKNKARQRDLESVVSRIDFGEGTNQVSERAAVDKALRSVANAVALAEEYQIQGSDVAAYEAAMNALTSELSRTGEIIDREQRRLDKLNRSRQQYHSKLTPLLQRWRALRATGEAAVGLRHATLHVQCACAWHTCAFDL